MLTVTVRNTTKIQWASHMNVHAQFVIIGLGQGEYKVTYMKCFQIMSHILYKYAKNIHYILKAT